MRTHRLLSACSLAVVLALGAVGTTWASTFTLGAITPTDPLSQSVIAPAGTVNDQFTFGFTVAYAPLNVYATLINAYTQNPDGSPATGLLDSGGPSSFVELFSGTPTGVNAPIPGSLSQLVFDPSQETVTGQTRTFLLPPGDYFLELTTSAPGAGGSPPLSNGGADFTVGLFAATAVPEPATWAMLILGLALIGLAARRRKSGGAALAC